MIQDPVPTYNDEQQLVVRLKKGEKKAFDELFRANFSKLYHFANTILGNPSRAKDIVQELFVNLWDKRSHLNENQSLISYLYVSVRNSCYTSLSRQRHYASLDELLNNPVLPTTDFEEENPSKRVLWKAIENLPLQQKIIFKLIVVEEYSYKEVAAKLDISVNTVKTQIQRAAKRLKTDLPPLEFFLVFFLFRTCYIDLKKLF